MNLIPEAEFIAAKSRRQRIFPPGRSASGTNPTAAVGGLLLIASADTREVLDEVREDVIAFLTEMVLPEGGLRVNGRAPLADLLSTFTAAWTLEQFGGLQRVDTEQVRRYAASLERAEGGFHGGLWDEGHDVEYKFYDLGVLALFP